MSLTVTPDIARAAYELLRTCQPFRRWSLPPADEIHFIVRETWPKGEDGPARRCTYLHPRVSEYASVSFTNTGWKLRVSQDLIGSLPVLITTIAHEMCHIRQGILGLDIDHGTEYARMADRICRLHSFDRKVF